MPLRLKYRKKYLEEHLHGFLLPALTPPFTAVAAISVLALLVTVFLYTFLGFVVGLNMLCHQRIVDNQRQFKTVKYDYDEYLNSKPKHICKIIVQKILSGLSFMGLTGEKLFICLLSGKKFPV